MSGTTNKRTGNPAWKKGMESPNKQGRPRGVKDRRSLINKKLLDATNDIADQVIEQARAGDLQAATLIFGRVLPALSPNDLTVTFALDPKASLVQQTEQVLTATATGEISPDVAKKILDCIATLGSIRHMEDFENRLILLEENAA